MKSGAWAFECHIVGYLSFTQLGLQAFNLYSPTVVVPAYVRTLQLAKALIITHYIGLLFPQEGINRRKAEPFNKDTPE